MRAVLCPPRGSPPALWAAKCLKGGKGVQSVPPQGRFLPATLLSLFDEEAGLQRREVICTGISYVAQLGQEAWPPDAQPDEHSFCK